MVGKCDGREVWWLGSVVVGKRDGKGGGGCGGVGGGFGFVNATWNKIACQDAAGSDNDDEIHFWDAKWISAVRGASVCAPTAQAQGGCRYTTQRPRRYLAESSPDEPPTISQRSYTPFVE